MSGSLTYALSGLTQGLSQGFLMGQERKHKERQDQTRSTLEALGGLLQNENVRPEAREQLLGPYMSIIMAKDDKGRTKAVEAAQQSIAEAGKWVGKPGSATMSVPLPPSVASVGGQPGAPMTASLPTPAPTGIFMSPEERAAQTAHTVEATAAGQTRGTIRGRLEATQGLKTPSELATALGQPGALIRQPKVLSRGISGADLVKSNPNIQTAGGEPIDAEGKYDLVERGTEQFAVPAQAATGKPRSFEAVKGQSGMTIGVKGPDGNIYYGDEPNIPIEARKLLQAAQAAEDRLFNRQEQVRAEAEARAARRMQQQAENATQAKLEADVIKASGEARKAKDALDSAERAAKSPTPRGDLQIVFDAVRSMVVGAGRMTNAEIQAELQAGSYGQRFERWFSVATQGTMPDDQRTQLLDVIRDAYESKRNNAAQDWEQTFGGRRAMPPHLRGATTGMPQAPTGSGTVRMRAPNGQEKDVPADQVEHYKQMGATVVNKKQ